MGLPEKEQEILSADRIEKVGEVGQAVEAEIGKIEQEAEEAVEQGTPKKTADVVEFRRPETREKPEVVKEELEGKSVKELEAVLADKLYSTKISDIETDPLIGAVIKQIADKLTDKDYKDENIASIISNIAYNSSNGDVGTYAWLLEKLESVISEILKNQPKM